MQIRSLAARGGLASKLQFRPTMRMTKLNQFFRDAGAAISRSPEVRQAVRQAVQQVEQQVAKKLTTLASPRGASSHFADGFEVAKPKPVALTAPASSASDADYVKGLYRDLLGREPDAEGFRSHVAGLARGASREDIRQVFLGSSEYAQKQAAPAAPAEPTAPEAPRTNTADAKNLGPVALEGFDGRKLADSSHNTVKYLFGRVATHFPLDSVKDHASAEALLNKMVPDLQAAGLEIVGVKRDKLLMKTPLGLESIDVVRGAGGGNPGWWWGADGTVASPPEIASFPPLSSSPNTPAPTTPTQPTQPTQPTGALVEPGEPLRTVPLLPEYLEANIDKSSPEAAVLSAARWARVKYAELFTRAEDRNVCAEIMTKVIGALRVAGYDATRVVNHASMPDGARWGSDAVVLNGTVFDVYRAMGQEAAPVAQNMGPYAPGRLRE